MARRFYYVQSVIIRASRSPARSQSSPYIAPPTRIPALACSSIITEAAHVTRLARECTLDNETSEICTALPFFAERQPELSFDERAGGEWNIYRVSQEERNVSHGSRAIINSSARADDEECKQLLLCPECKALPCVCASFFFPPPFLQISVCTSGL